MLITRIKHRFADHSPLQQSDILYPLSFEEQMIPPIVAVGSSVVGPDPVHILPVR